MHPRDERLEHVRIPQRRRRDRDRDAFAHGERVFELDPCASQTEIDDERSTCGPRSLTAHRMVLDADRESDRAAFVRAEMGA